MMKTLYGPVIFTLLLLIQWHVRCTTATVCAHGKGEPGTDGTDGSPGADGADAAQFIGDANTVQISDGESNRVWVQALVYDESTSNVGLGHASLGAAVAGTATSNVGVGSRSLAALTTGAYVVGAGARSCASVTTGQRLTCLGASADASSGIENSTAIGAGARATSSNQLMLGNDQVQTVVKHASASVDIGSNSNRFANVYVANANLNGLTITTSPARGAVLLSDATGLASAWSDFGLFYKATSISSSDWLNLRVGSGKELIPTPGAGRFIHIASSIIVFTATSTAYAVGAGGSVIQHRYGTSSNFGTAINAALISATSSSRFAVTVSGSATVFTCTGVADKALNLFNTGATDFTTGTGTAVSHIWYTIESCS